MTVREIYSANAAPSPPRSQRRALLATILAMRSGAKVQLDQTPARCWHLVYSRNLAVAQLHDRNASNIARAPLASGSVERS